jgi:hypothetical protein
LGIVFLITPIDAGPTFGRRLSDRFYGRRSSDNEAPCESLPAEDAGSRHPMGSASIRTPSEGSAGSVLDESVWSEQWNTENIPQRNSAFTWTSRTEQASVDLAMEQMTAASDAPVSPSDALQESRQEELRQRIRIAEDRYWQSAADSRVRPRPTSDSSGRI